MTQLRLIVAAAAGSLMIAAAAYATPPYASGSAQDRARAACLKQDVRPTSSTWELCLSHATRAYELGEGALAQQLAKAAGEAKVSCLDQGFDAESSGYRACVEREMQARSQLQILGDDMGGENVAEAH